MANLMQLRQSVRARLGVGVNDNFVTDELIDSHINIAVQTIEAEGLWPWQERRVTLTTTANVEELALPTDWSRNRALKHQLNEIHHVVPYDLDRYRGSGVPSHYSIIGNKMLLGPTPSSAMEVTLYYYKTPAYLAEDRSTPELPARYYPAVIAKAAELMSIREDDRASAGSHLAEYLQWTNRMRRENRTTSRPAGRRIRPGGWV
jgi:hypothetical protein